MSIILPPEFEAFVNVRVASGAYTSEQDVLRAAFDLLQRRDELLAHIDEGTQQLRAGQYQEFGDDDRERFLTDNSAAVVEIETQWTTRSAISIPTST